MRVQTDTVRRGFVLVLAEAVRCFSRSVDPHAHPARAIAMTSTDRSQLSTTQRQQMDQQDLQQVRRRGRDWG